MLSLLLIQISLSFSDDRAIDRVIQSALTEKYGEASTLNSLALGSPQVFAVEQCPQNVC